MKDSIKKFLEFNGTEIQLVLVDKIWWVALKPICDALNVDWRNQHKKLKEDLTLNELSRDHEIVAADGKLRNMTCLPERVIYGWLFQIQSQSPELLEYKWECYNILYDHFHGTIAQRGTILMERITIENEIKELERKLEANEDYKNLVACKKLKKEKSTLLTYLDKNIVTGQIKLFNADEEQS